MREFRVLTKIGQLSRKCLTMLNKENEREENAIIGGALTKTAICPPVYWVFYGTMLLYRKL